MNVRALPLLCLLLGLWAYRAVLSADGSGPPQQRIEQWFFESSGTSPGLVAGTAAWLTWRRLPAWMQLPTSRRLFLPSIFFAISLFVYAWATLAAAPDLLLVSLATLGLGFADAQAGARGLRVMVLPALVLGLALPIPAPLRNDVVWQLQLWSAAGAEVLLNALGVEVSRVGISLQHGETRFLVIESCSGLRSLRSLILVAVVLRELFSAGGPRMWWLVAAAAPLALLLNAVRIAIIATDASLGTPVLGDQHVGQGLLVLAAGTTLLFAAAHFLAGREAPHGNAPRGGHAALPWRLLLPPLALVALLGSVLQPWPAPQPKRLNPALIPMTLGNWQGTSLDNDRLFLGDLPLGNVLHYLYEFQADGERSMEVSLLVAAEAPGRSRDSPFSPKLLLPGREWESDAAEPLNLFVISAEASAVNARSGDTEARVYGWALLGGSVLADSLRSLLALERGPFARERERVYVRVATASGPDAESRRRAGHTLDRFIHDFREILTAL